MKKECAPAVVGIWALALASACTPASPAPSSAASRPAPAASVSAPAASPTSVASLSPVASPSAASSPSASPASASLDQLVAAAKQEGQVSILGPNIAAEQSVLIQGFQDAYGINVDYFADPGPGIPPKLSTERAAGQYNWDVWSGGTTTGMTSLIPMNVFDPIEGALLPETKNPANWRDGSPAYLDDAHVMLTMSTSQQGDLVVNTDLVKPGDITSWKDLLDPKWKGKIAVDDPRRNGPGKRTWVFFYLQPDLGTSYMRALAAQDVTLYQDFTQEADAVGHGESMVLVGPDAPEVLSRHNDGISEDFVPPSQLKEGTDLGSGNAGLGIFNHAPHPNAAKLFVNWLLSQQGQTLYSQATGYLSTRLDVSTDVAPSWSIPVPGSIRTYDATALPAFQDVTTLTTQLFQ